ncbi:MAG: 50S ribosomal protein L29 [Ktedonobacteraceae bacterium]|nr:50S ribosomal protein L29 [Ktedonobacteraceae bacterium]
MSKLSERRKEISEYTEQQAQKELQELRLKLFNLRLQKQRGEVKNSRIFAETRKDIARLLHHLTILRKEREQ